MTEHDKIIIIGSGPAGFTAALYAGRANMDTVVFEGNQPGGQLTITTEVENYPGFPDGVMGPEMMEIFRKQAHRFGAKSIFETIIKVDFSQRPFRLWSDRDKSYTADAVIISTGATARRLFAKEEDKFWGFGISACATCDGFFFKNQKIYVIGGGDTAFEEANYLTHFASSVTIIHRRQEFRASKIMIERAKNNPKIDFLLDSVIEEYTGEENMGIKRLTGINVKNVKTGEITSLPADGVFIAIGHTPNTEIFKGILDMDENGYLITKGKSTYTNIEGVFACGDVQDHIYRQAVTAAGTGCAAAIDAERWLAEQNQ
ncbi:MAG: thioredoxin-disulfide reductase [Ignavibacteria bacterium GWB2_35_12]|nr:MAG: thioredoxin-disulfide reductase [Ignavibacteria bacterium GWA2_35_8]OGU42270.1 MAG: thioredoxin-disulfide reductase [Ignavibacteria bacterium GWB2_35_12]OGU93534.1 MAG: thioredoxin-disulfide reductase [Ignavibacteria bacterium RIFOXYA2_FULL_35_10]OGV22155.1 MAG: thioredoxin-disulfide reductase [Ignavibacteria bacterium RIFOXYC2_FULL_35_21]